jgi:hypothetical protein
VLLNSEVNVAKQGENVMLPFDGPGEDDSGPAFRAHGALALLPADPATATEAAIRLADYAQAWGITVSADVTPAAKAQVAYWRELCGAIALVGRNGMGDSGWPADLAPSRSTLQVMAERGLIVRRRRAWHLKRKWHA